MHFPWEMRGNRWKVLAIAVCNLHGENFNFLHMKVAWRDVQDALHEGLAIVLDAIRTRGYKRRLMGIIYNGCPAKLVAEVNAARESPVLWSYTHLRKILANDHEIMDTVLEDTYRLEFNANDWRDKVYPTVYGDVEDLIAREVREVKLLVARICSYPATPFTTICSLNCNNLELWCISIISLVKKVVELMPKPSWEEFEQNQHRFIARLVGVAEILARSAEGTR
ncbi:uncharacterized protein LOC108163896 [Drosophila miranda]|uniref:uncharacterized protein LOC108163896 n=1 Tax=Drosophila miranda TaxID=7229 RepID=UPI0007E6E545|nr:uncharacterized protein LOC108163896 [Drosophila miranda]